MTIFYRVVLWLVLVIAGFATGYLYRDPTVITKTDIKWKERVVTKIVREKTTNPDGTVIERETEETNRKTDKKEKAKRPEPSSIARYKPKYSIGLKWHPQWTDAAWKPVATEVGYRVTGDLWTTAEYNWEVHHALIGIKLEL